MTTNEERAQWGKTALEAFEAECGPPISDDKGYTTAADMICDVLHHLEQLGLEDADCIACVQHAVGMWHAERRAPEGEPPANDNVTITISETWTPETGTVRNDDDPVAPLHETGGQVMPVVLVRVDSSTMRFDSSNGDHPVYGRADWRHEVSNGDTVLGYEEWVAQQIEAETNQP